jgi:transcriptional regulator with XRE-family HTH domain
MTANGQRIRELREGQSLGIRTLAQRAGVHRSHLSRLERGIKGASPELLHKIAGALAVPMAEITNGEPS